jgi:hypothetical protein
LVNGLKHFPYIRPGKRLKILWRSS